MNRLTQLAAGVILASGVVVSSTASADVSYNIGWASEYFYRGALQKNSSGSAGIDYEFASQDILDGEGGFSIGSWTADVGDGLEVDLYGAYGIELDSGFTASIGFTGYYYTGEFDDTYEEVNFNFGYGIASVEYSVGEYGNFGPSLDYDYFALTLDFGSGFYGKFGTFGDELDGDHFEFGYGTTVADFDVGVAVIFSSDEFAGVNGELTSAGKPDESEAIVFSIGKSF
jgi:uncharacterized protein (TIGR02001 family)